MNNALELWSKEVDFPVTVCDKDGIIIAMNDKSIELFGEDGGAALLGKSLLDCHPEPSKSKLIHMLKNQLSNTYIETHSDHKRFVHEAPWYSNGEYCGLVEILIDIPEPDSTI